VRGTALEPLKLTVQTEMLHNLINIMYKTDHFAQYTDETKECVQSEASFSYTATIPQEVIPASSNNYMQRLLSTKNSELVIYFKRTYCTDF